MDLLRQRLAPISDAAWRLINDEAKTALTLNLSGRRIVDVSEPRGLKESCLGTGRLEVPEKQDDTVRWGIRRSLPLVEVRVPFELDQWELDSIDRGGEDPDLGDLQRAAREIARFEERVVYDGFEPASIRGLVASSKFEPVTVSRDEGGLVDAVAKAVMNLRYAHVEGPYSLALGGALYQWLDSSTGCGYPVRKHLREQIDGPVVLAPYLEGGLLISRRGGDAELHLGLDLAVGYERHDQRKIQLYFTESFTFRVVTPEALVALRVAGTS